MRGEGRGERGVSNNVRGFLYVMLWDFILFRNFAACIDTEYKNSIDTQIKKVLERI